MKWWRSQRDAPPQEKHLSCKQKAPGSSCPPRSSSSKRSGLERSLRRLSVCRNQAELFHLGQHIVVGVETGDLPIPELEDRTGPQFARALQPWKPPPRADTGDRCRSNARSPQG